jgi:hypothetical protein
MNQIKYELLAVVSSRFEAELLESYLEAYEIDVELFQESVGQNAFPVATDILGRVQVFVPKEKIDQAKELLNSFTFEE